MIEVLVPVLNRPAAAAPLVENILSTCPEAYVHFLVSPGDTKQIKALTRIHDQDGRVIISHVPFGPGPGDYARKINWGYEFPCAGPGEWIFTGADDLRFHPDWFDHALDRAYRTDASVVGTQDLCNPSVKRGLHSTHSMIARSYIEEQGASWDGPGTVLHEGYDHQCVDNELCRVAMERGEWAFANDSVVEHLHWICGKGQRDQTAEKAFAKGREDIRLYQQRLKRYGKKLP